MKSGVAWSVLCAAAIVSFHGTLNQLKGHIGRPHHVATEHEIHRTLYYVVTVGTRNNQNI